MMWALRGAAPTQDAPFASTLLLLNDREPSESESLPAPDLHYDKTPVTSVAPTTIVLPPPEAETTTPPTRVAGTVDWMQESEKAGTRALAALAGPQPRRFGDVEPSRPFKVCRRKPDSFEWKSEPKKAGFAGGLPYFRVGKRCVVVIPPIFGCALGELPPANGELLKDMRDPDRARSSVPSDDDCLPDEVTPPSGH